MRQRLPFFLLVSGLLVSAAWQPLAAQYGFDLEIKKPEPYDNRVLKAEKTGDKKLKGPRRFFQNTYTHYNYHFNANNKLNEVLYQAKQAHKDDYTLLLPFYNYNLDATAGNAMLDSVIYKARTGIVMHDLRNDWIDNMYMLWGAAYFFQKKFDSSSLMFQFINHSFAEKEKDGYYRYIGSRMDGNDATSIATKEKTGLVQKVFSTSPSRNDAFIWQIRSQIEMGNLTDAGTLIVMLKNDPNFPKRLHDDLEEVQAYWFYKQQIWDSAAAHLVKALDQAQNKGELARWEYLAAQLFERSRNSDEALKWYAKAQGHSIDPVMDVFARLNQVRLNKDGGDNYVERNIAELVKMARREKFSEYSEIIYYMAAQMELERGNLAAAQDLLQRGVNKQGSDPKSRNLIFLKIADLSFDQRKYVPAASFYDSVQTGSLKPEEADRVNGRKPQLTKVVFFANILLRQDSLQRIAAMPEDQRKDYITKLVKRLRKQQGLAEEANAVTSGRAPQAGPAPDLFNNQQQNRGEWYFYNDNLKAQGAQQFKQVWGNRPNTDNWRRFSDVSKQLVAKSAGNNPMAAGSGQTGDQAADDAGQAPTYASLLAKLPLTPEAIQRSNDSVRNSLFSLGTIYLREMEDYVSAIETFEKLRGLFPDFSPMDELAYHLFFAYSKTGDVVKAALFKNMLKEKFPSSRYTAIVFTGKDPSVNTEQVKQVTKTYEGIYDMFIEGRFAEAVEAKRKADSTYQTTQWQPQLLYIEAVYRIKNREDSAAKLSLNTLIAQDPKAPMAQKAKTMLDVLNRRQQIEDELNRLEIDRPLDDTRRSASIAVADKPAVTQPKVDVQKPLPVPEIRQEEDPKLSGEKQRGVDASGRLTGVTARPGAPRLDTTGGRKLQFAQPMASSVYTFDVGMPHYAVVMLNKVDVVFTNESKNAFARFSRERFYTQNPGTEVTELDSANRMLLIGPFSNAQDAIDYVVLAKKTAASEIIPWLKPERYSFLIISPNNLDILRNDKDLQKYRKFLEAQVPGKF